MREHWRRKKSAPVNTALAGPVVVEYDIMSGERTGEEVNDAGVQWVRGSLSDNVRSSADGTGLVGVVVTSPGVQAVCVDVSLRSFAQARDEHARGGVFLPAYAALGGV